MKFFQRALQTNLEREIPLRNSIVLLMSNSLTLTFGVQPQVR